MESWILIEMQKKINILGAFDMDKDNLIDVLYIDENKNVRLFFIIIFLSFNISLDLLLIK